MLSLSRFTECTEPAGILTQAIANFQDMKSKIDSGGGVECHSLQFSLLEDLVAWFESLTEMVSALWCFCDAFTLLHSIQVPVISTKDASKTCELQHKIEMTSSLEASIITSMDTILPVVLIGNKMYILGGTFECLKSYLKGYDT